MERPTRWHIARSRAYPTFSTLLLFGALLPKSSLAQITSDAAPTTLQTIASSLTSVIPSPTSISSDASSAASSGASIATVTASATPTSNPDQREFGGGFNYYYIGVVLVALAFVAFLIFMGRRKRNERAIWRANRERALTEDVRGYSSPRYGRGWGWPSVNGDRTTPPRGVGRRQRREDVIEGLNERGEAPPPYMEGGKPPSLRSVSTNGTGPADRCQSRASVNRRPSDDLELGDMRRPVYNNSSSQPHPNGEPPAYHGTQPGHPESSPEMSTLALPAPAVTRP